MARDGHIVIGPYNEFGELWQNHEHDACNGVQLDDDSYAYVSTTEAPHTVGCWGPATQTSSCAEECEEIDWNWIETGSIKLTVTASLIITFF